MTEKLKVTWRQSEHGAVFPYLNGYAVKGWRWEEGTTAESVGTADDPAYVVSMVRD